MNEKVYEVEVKRTYVLVEKYLVKAEDRDDAGILAIGCATHAAIPEEFDPVDDEVMSIERVYKDVED